MRLRTNFILVLALLVLGLAIFKFANPSRSSRIGPGPLLLIALLLGVRYVIARQAQKRSNPSKDVSPRPLGLTDDSSDHT
jgi:small neutral amino acid transporter SnatA (MarC family)